MVVYPTLTLSCVNRLVSLPQSLILFGHPLLFWFTLPALFFTIYKAFREKSLSLFFLATCFLVLYLPWMTIDRPKYFYYMLPAVPFMAMMVAYSLWQMWPKGNSTSPTQNLEVKNLPPAKINWLHKLLAPILNFFNRIMIKFLAAYRLRKILVIIYLILYIAYFFIAYPLLAAIPVSDKFRHAVFFFWQFLIK